MTEPVQHPHMTDYLARQRWFSAPVGRFTVSAVQPLSWLSDPLTGLGVRIELVTVTTANGRHVYNLPLAYRSEPVDSIGYGLVGMETWDEGDFYVYDAMHDPEARTVLMNGFFGPPKVADMVFHRTGIEIDVDADTPSVALSVDQSNTSIIVGETALLKWFRRVVPGRNPDVEVHQALSGPGSDSVAALFGWISTSNADGLPGYDLAMLQRFLRTATDGWESARTSVRDLLADPELAASEAGGDFAGDAERLGATTAHVHELMADSFPTEIWATEQLGALAERLRARLTAAAADAPMLAPLVPRIEECYDALARLDMAVHAQRVHGDLHLGQTLRTTAGWKIIDFEGEPAAPLAERTMLDTPARDLAGMLRSFDYAAHSVLLQTGADTLERAEEWVARNRAAFLSGYGFVPDEGATIVLSAYEIDKAVYEVVYELHHRPDWVTLPLRALERLVS